MSGEGFPCEDLDAAVARVWALLERGAADRRSAFHTPMLATVDGQGAPQVRTVVLRGADAGQGRLWCHSDRRSPKVTHLIDRPAAQFAFYDRRLKLQVRASMDVAVLTDGPVADRAWQQSTLWARRCYLAPDPPSTALDTRSANLPDGLDGRQPSEAESQAGRANFCVIMGTVQRIDWLYLAHGGHWRGEMRRANGAHQDRVDWALTWLAP
jgi:hypothetical protein